MDNLTPPPVPLSAADILRDPREGGAPTVHERLVAREVVVVSPGGKRKALIAASDERVGVWIYGARGDGPAAAVWLDENGAAFGAYDTSLPEGEAPVAMGLGPDGRPFLQMTHPRTGKVLHLDFEKLERLLGLLGEEG